LLALSTKTATNNSRIPANAGEESEGQDGPIRYGQRHHPNIRFRLPVRRTDIYARSASALLTTMIGTGGSKAAPNYNFKASYNRQKSAVGVRISTRWTVGRKWSIGSIWRWFKSLFSTTD
jgi:hypothetical protein